MTQWNEFFHAREVPYGMALARIALPLVLLTGVVPRWWYARELYSTDGSPAPLWVSYGSAPLLPDLAAPVAVALVSILIVSLFAACVGWMTRLSLVVACVLYAGFGIIDSMATLTKYTAIAAHVLMLLAISNCGSVWSVDAWLHRRASQAPRGLLGPRLSPVWPRRLLQIFIGIVYMGAAVTKMHTPAYFSGDQLMFWMLADMNFDNSMGQVLTLYPSVLTVMAYVTIIWEILFVFLIWSKVWRVPMLIVGLGFHLMTYFTLGLIIFPLVYFAAYLAFIETHEAERMAVLVRRGLRRLGLAVNHRRTTTGVSPSAWSRPAYAAVAWGMLMATVAVVGVEVEHRRDVYSKHGRQGPLQPKVLEPQVAKAMLGPAQPIRPKDLYFGFDVGTSTLGGILCDRREVFRHGERAIIQCSLQPPHPDMWVEVNLHDSDDHLLKRVGTVVPREDLRAEFFYDLDESMLPGEYDFVLKYDGEELTRRRITLTGPTPKLTASR